MSLKNRLSKLLDHTETGRALRARMRIARIQTSTGPPHPSIAHLKMASVETSYFCNLRCKMCPRLYEGHKEGLMPLERFTRLTPLFSHLQLVLLTGWGEPLINPLLPRFVSLVRACNARAHLVSNAMLLDETKAAALLDAGINDFQVSVDAGTRETYEEIRAGASWDRVLSNAGRFNRMVHERHADVRTGWVFVMMRRNFREMPQALQLAVDFGFQLFTGKLIEMADLEYEREEILHKPDGELAIDPVEFQEVLDKCDDIARRNGIETRFAHFNETMNEACAADPMANVFIDWLGNVVPCCQLPVRDEQTHATGNAFGNIDEQDILEILMSRQAQHFYASWPARIVPRVCKGCYQLCRIPGIQEYTREG